MGAYLEDIINSIADFCKRPSDGALQVDAAT